MQREDGGPAFPTTAGQTVYSHGMTLRDWFAGQALAGMAATDDADSRFYSDLARSAYRYADAMIEARSK